MAVTRTAPSLRWVPSLEGVVRPTQQVRDLRPIAPFTPVSHLPCTRLVGTQVQRENRPRMTIIANWWAALIQVAFNHEDGTGHE